MLRKDAANKGTKKGERKLGRMNTKKIIDEIKLNMRSEGRNNKSKTQGEEWKRQEINGKREGRKLQSDVRRGRGGRGQTSVRSCHDLWSFIDFRHVEKN